MTPAKPTEHHIFLNSLIGDWTFDSGEGAERHHGTVRCRSLGGLWFVLDCDGHFSAGSWQSQYSIGYDPAQAKYVASFFGSSMNDLWVLAGDRTPGSRSVVLHTEGPKFNGSGRTKYRDTFTLTDDDHWTLTSELIDDEGNWTQFMNIPHKRAR
jgi:hypothetical protein